MDYWKCHGYQTKIRFQLTVTSSTSTGSIGIPGIVNTCEPFTFQHHAGILKVKRNLIYWWTAQCSL